MLDPAGHYVSSLEGVRVRDYDAEHISVAGGEWLRPKLLPALVALGSGHYAARAGMSPLDRRNPTTTSAPSSASPNQARSLARLRLAGQLMSGR